MHRGGNEDFDIDIRGHRDAVSIVARSRAGEASAESTLGGSLGTRFLAVLERESQSAAHGATIAEERAARRRRAIADLQAIGDELSEAIFPGPVRELFLRRFDATRNSGRLRLRIRSPGPRAFSLPWELLLHPTTRQFLSVSADSPIVRHPDLPQSTGTPVLTGAIRLLAQLASPEDAPKLDMHSEVSSLETALGPLVTRGDLEITRPGDESISSMVEAFRRISPHIFHFAGHGWYDAVEGGILLLRRPDGTREYLRADQLAHLCAAASELRLVVLNACRGADPAQVGTLSEALLSGGVTAVAGMQAKISDGAAVEFTRAFYQSVADGYPIDSAMAEARLALFLRGSHEFATPALYMRSPSGVLFERSMTAGPASARRTCHRRRPAMRIFIVSAPDDDVALQQLEAHLSVMRRAGLVELTSLSNLGFGNAEAAAREKLEHADIVLLLVTPRLHAADVGYSMIRTALSCRKKNPLVIPLLVTPCHIAGAPYADLVALPRNRKFVTTSQNPDAVWAEIAREIHDFVASLAGNLGVG